MSGPREEREVVVNEPAGNNPVGIIIAVVGVLAIIVLLFMLLGGGAEDDGTDVTPQDGTTEVEGDTDTGTDTDTDIDLDADVDVDAPDAPTGDDAGNGAADDAEGDGEES